MMLAPHPDAPAPTPTEIAMEEEVRAHPLETPTHRQTRRAGWKAWLLWTLYTTVGYLSSLALSIAAQRYLAGGILLGPLVGILGMALTGLLQWLVLRRYVPGMRWLGWMLATAFGQLFGAIIVAIAILGPVLFGVLGDLPEMIGASQTQFMITFTGGFVLGIVIGLLQWLVLRRYVRLRASAWWILGSAIPQGIAAAASAGNLTALGLTGLTAVLAAKLFDGLIIGSVTGAVLVWLLRKATALAEPIPQTQPLDA
jgi:hypothetical protein